MVSPYTKLYSTSELEAGPIAALPTSLSTTNILVTTKQADTSIKIAAQFSNLPTGRSLFPPRSSSLPVTHPSLEPSDHQDQAIFEQSPLQCQSHAFSILRSHSDIIRDVQKGPTKDRSTLLPKVNTSSNYRLSSNTRKQL
jgi:hypothetical protein